SPYSRRSLAPIPWNVPAQVSAPTMAPELLLMTCRAMRSMRRVISAAARREKVISRIRRGSAPLTIRWATRWATVLVFPEPAPAGDQEGCPWSRVLLPDAMLDGSSLFAIEGLEIGDGHRWQIGLQQVKPINHLSRFVRNSYQVSTLPYAGRQGSSTVVPAKIEGTALTCR